MIKKLYSIFNYSSLAIVAVAVFIVALNIIQGRIVFYVLIFAIVLLILRIVFRILIVIQTKKIK
jgi:hypothetical protein